MVFGSQKLQDEIFCLTQERDFFQSKFLEQVSQIQELKLQAERSRKEISRLRRELMKTGHSGRVSIDSSVVDKTTDEAGENRVDDAVLSDLSSESIGRFVSNRSEQSCSRPTAAAEIKKDEDLTEKTYVDDEEDDDEDDDAAIMDNDSQAALDLSIRQDAAKLLNWADYRESARTSVVCKTGVDTEGDVLFKGAEAVVQES